MLTSSFSKRKSIVIIAWSAVFITSTILISPTVCAFTRTSSFQSQNALQRTVPRSQLIHNTFAIYGSSNDRVNERSQNNNRYRHGKNYLNKANRPNRRRRDTRVNPTYLQQAAESLLVQSLLENGRWHQAVSLLHAWLSLAKDYAQAPEQMQIILAKLQDEYETMIERIQRQQLQLNLPSSEQTGNEVQENRISSIEDNVTVFSSRDSDIITAPLFELDIEWYNLVLDAWACAALFHTHNSQYASQKAREFLVYMQASCDTSIVANRIEIELADAATTTTGTNSSCTTTISTNFPKPNKQSFALVAHVVCRVEGAWMARRLLAWREYLYKSGKHPDAQPTHLDYIRILEAYAQSNEVNAGFLAQGFLRHLKAVQHQPVDTTCYNLAIKAWAKSRKGRDAAEQAEQILLTMEAPPDAISYATVIGAWAASGARSHAIERAEAMLRRMEEHDGLEPNTIVVNAVMSTWVKSRNPGAVERTAELLQHLDQPDSFSYNTHLHALSIHSSKDETYAERASTLLQQWENDYDTGKVRFGPNTFSYNNVIEAFCKSTSSNAVQRCADTLRQMVKRDGVEPDTFSFNQVMAALSRVATSSSAQKAQDLLQYQVKAYQSGVHPRAPPDATGFSTVITAHARSGARGAAEQAESLFDQMKQLYAKDRLELKPTIICYNTMIDCWAKSGEGTLGARKAEALVDEMRKAYEAGDRSMQPNLVTYNALLNAWARSNTRCCGRKAETYLNHMWEMYNAGDKQVKPNDFSYNTVINAISKSKNSEKAQKALRMLRRMDKLYQAGNKEARPDIVTYTAVLNSCAFPAASDFRTRRKALDTAIFTLRELRKSRYGQPNQITYGTFIRACATLLHDDDKQRREVLEQVFKQCCNDGQVGEMVLCYLRKAAPPGLYEELLADFICSTGETISVEDLPLEWRCNVRNNTMKKRIVRDRQEKV